MYCPYCSRVTKVYIEYVDNKVFRVCSLCDRTLQVDINNKCINCEFVKIEFKDTLDPYYYCTKFNKYIVGSHNDFWCKK